MIYLSLFWILVLIFLIVYLTSKVFRVRSLINFFDDKGILFFLGLTSLLVVAIATKDPLLGLDIPVELQWIGSLLVMVFGSWKFYLNPLKKKVYTMDREIGEIKSEMKIVREDLQIIKEKLMKRA